MDPRPLISIEGLARRFGDPRQPAVFENIWFGIDRGEFEIDYHQIARGLVEDAVAATRGRNRG